MWFNIDYKRLVVLLLPTFLRKQVLVAYLFALIAPIDTLYKRWFWIRENNIKRLERNGQVCYLEGALNDDYDSQKRRIRISDDVLHETLYIYTREENRPKFLGELIIYPKELYKENGLNFTVHIPLEYQTAETEIKIKTTIEAYKLAGKTYRINYE